VELNHPEYRLIDLFVDVAPLEPCNVVSGIPSVTENADIIPTILPSESGNLMWNTVNLSPLLNSNAGHVVKTSGSTTLTDRTGSIPTVTLPSHCESGMHVILIVITMYFYDIVNPESPPSYHSSYTVKTSASTGSTATLGSMPYRLESAVYYQILAFIWGISVVNSNAHSPVSVTPPQLKKTLHPLEQCTGSKYFTWERREK